jgi:hypothetical protein
LNLKTNQGFEVGFVYFATVPPYDAKKKEKNKDLYYTLVDAKGEVSDYLFKIFDDAPNDCKVEIIFTSVGNQQNEIRTLLLRIANAKTMSAKENAANGLTMKMYEVTDFRNETGLFIIMEGKKGTRSRLVLARFKRNEGLYNHGTTLEYLRNVFTKSSHYKLATYEDTPSDKSFWKGYAIDRQTSTTTYKPFSYFWIENFLQSQTSITSVQGTTQLSKVVKTLLKQTKTLEEQEQVISAIVNLKSKRDAQISVKKFCENYLSRELTKIVQKEVTEDFFNSVFPVDKEVMKKELGATVLTLDGGITANIPTFQYEKYVKEVIKDGQKKVTIEGILKGKRVNTGKETVLAESKPKKRGKKTK